MEKEIVQKNEVVSVLNNVRLKHLAVSIKDIDGKFNLNGFLTRSDTNSMAVFFDQVPDYLPIKNLQICFDYNKTFYASSETAVKMLNLSLKSIELMVPEKFVFHPTRKYARTDTSEILELYVKRIETGVSDKNPAINIDELPATLRNIYLELQGNVPDIKKIISMIGEELNRYSNRFRINLFKDMNSLAPIEKVVNLYKKTFWIGDTDNLNNYIHLGDKYSIIGYEKYFEMIKKTMAPDILEQIRQNYISRGINSYAMVPITVGDRVVGVIELSVPNDSKFKKLSIYEIFYVKGLADILAEVVVKTHESNTSPDMNFQIKDISIGGILANTKNVYITRTLKEQSVVSLGIRTDNKEMEVKARVVRYNYIPGDNAGLNVGFEFLIDDEGKRQELTTLIKKIGRSLNNEKNKHPD